MSKPAAVKLSRMEQLVSQFLKRKASFAKIDFSFAGSRRISHESFAQVAKYIDDGKIHVQVTKDSQGRYDPYSKVIQVPADHAAQGTSMLGGFLVHESVHAHGDIQGKSVPVETDEGCAYISQTIFQITKTGATGFDKKDHPVRDIAMHFMKIGGLEEYNVLKNRFLAWLKTKPHAVAGYTGKYEYPGFK